MILIREPLFSGPYGVERSISAEASLKPERSPAKRVREGEEGQRTERAFAAGGSEGYGACPDEVKLIRAQGECLGIRSR